MQKLWSKREWQKWHHYTPNFFYLRNNTLLYLQMILMHMINYAPFIQCVHCVNNLNSLLKTNLNLLFSYELTHGWWVESVQAWSAMCYRQCVLIHTYFFCFSCWFSWSVFAQMKILTTILWYFHSLFVVVCLIWWFFPPRSGRQLQIYKLRWVLRNDFIKWIIYMANPKLVTSCSCFPSKHPMIKTFTSHFLL